MTIVYTALSVFIGSLLILVASMRPTRADMSEFELRRRSEKGDEKAKKLLEKETSADDIRTILQIVTALLLVVFVLTSVLWHDWLIGTIAAVVMVLEYGAVAQLKYVHAFAQTLYGYIEPYLLKFVKAGQKVLRFVRFQPDVQPNREIYSKEELVELIRNSRGVLTADELRRLTSGLEFESKLVSEVMTPRTVVDTVASDELLGPLTLDDLHKTGHSRLPVVQGDIDHIIGILYIQDLLVATAKKTPTAREAMEPKVYYIREDQTLQHALSAFLKTHHHLFVVVNEYRETVGVLSLEDVIEAMLGQKIIDEFDSHDDLRKVAERNPADNNKPKNHTDV